MFPAVIDNTIRKSFVECPTKAFHRHVQNLQPVGAKSVDLVFGGAFARGIEIARKMFFERSPAGAAPLPAGEAIAAGIEAAVKEWGDFDAAGGKFTYKTLDRLVGAIRYYFAQWPLGEDGLTPVAGGIECRFDIALPVCNPDTMRPIHYAGRYDMHATDTNARHYVVDEKTTSKLGDSWNYQWDLDAQMTGYIWSVREAFRMKAVAKGLITYETEVPELLAQIRGISILKNDFGHVEIPVVRPDWMIDRWYNQLLRDVRRMVRAYEDGEWDVALHSGSCVAYGRQCDYMGLCLSPNPERLIEGHFKEVIWNPLAK